MFVNYNTVNMKILFNSVIVLLALGTLLTYSGCDGGGGNGPSVEEVQLEKLSGEWSVTATSTNVTLDGVSKKTDYANFKLTLTGTAGATSFGYTTTGRPALSPWPSTGTWTFGANPESTIIRDPDKTADTLEMTYTVSDTQLELTFTFSKQGYSRTKQVTGVWVFTMAK
jgi:hypothetical protein